MRPTMREFRAQLKQRRHMNTILMEKGMADYRHNFSNVSYYNLLCNSPYIMSFGEILWIKLIYEWKSQI